MEIDGDVKIELQRRLARIEGQVRGIQNMLAEDRECRDVVTQIAAAAKALETVGFRLLASGLTSCLQDPEKAAAEGYPVAEVEKLFLKLHQELPYHSTVETESWKELRNGETRIEQTIYVERESQRKIVLGKGGQTIKAIGADARKDIAEMADVAIHLFLFVKVREGWGDDPERYREMGIEFPKG